MLKHLGETKSGRALALALVVLTGGCASRSVTATPPTTPSPATPSPPRPSPPAASDVTLHHSLTLPEARRAGEELARSLQQRGLTWEWKSSERDVIAWRVERGLLRGSEGELTVREGSVTVRFARLPALLPAPLVSPTATRRLRQHFPQ